MFEYFMSLPSLQDKLKPITCPSCKDEGYHAGICKKCMENQAYNKEWLMTHPFVFDKTFCNYHTGRHDEIKALPLRLANEHPYLLYGIEIEVEFDSRVVSIYDADDDYDEDDDNWKINEILDKFSEITNGLFVYEHDSSLDNGVELISRPCSYAYWTADSTVDMLKRGFDFLKEHGALTDQPIENGLHIHLSNKFFDKGESTKSNPEQAYEGFDWLFQKFQPEIEKLGGRKYGRFCNSKAGHIKDNLERNACADYYNAEVKLKCKIKKGGAVPNGDHCFAVIKSGPTIEARVFKSTIDYTEVLSYIEIVRNMAHFVRDGGRKESLDSILHTKENLYLDRHIQKVKMNCAKNKESLNLNKLNDDKLEITL